MSKFGYLLLLKNEPIGIFDNEEQLNNFISGCLQNRFFNNIDIKTKKFIMNSINCLEKEVSKNSLEEQKQFKLQENGKKQFKDKINEKKELETKELLEKKRKEILESEEYKNLMQGKIETKHQLNELKQKKKKLEEEKETYVYDLEMYQKLKKEKEKMENFVIPEIFKLKYDVFEKLEENNITSFDNFKTEWDRIKPSNNYSLFASNPYENSFISSDLKKELEIELDI
jgi:hypothetical protein